MWRYLFSDFSASNKPALPFSALSVVFIIPSVLFPTVLISYLRIMYILATFPFSSLLSQYTGYMYRPVLLSVLLVYFLQSCFTHHPSLLPNPPSSSTINSSILIHIPFYCVSPLPVIIQFAHSVLFCLHPVHPYKCTPSTLK
jgi:hypothetical protein